MMVGFAIVLVGPLSVAWWSLIVWSVSANSISAPSECDVARMKCAYRTSCSRALHSYMVDCADVLAGRTTRCPWACKRALISLTSTEMGLALSECDCGDNEFCRSSKERAEVCRPEVSYATADDTVVSCSVAEWICAADPLCSTALDYYHRFCRSMFHGRKCTPRCNNSLAILDRQEKAVKLRNCYCDGSEDFPCHNIKKNTQLLCYGRDEWMDNSPYFPSTTSETDSGSLCPVPSGLIYLLLCLLVLWTFRTSVSTADYFTVPTRNCETFITNSKCLPYQHLQKRNSEHFKQKIWPWW
ncbi:Growth arrest-specific protein 1, partial [Stegodyphus mimosarum]